MQKIIGIMLLMAGVSVSAMAGNLAPEIDMSSAGSAIALISGAVLVMRARRR